MKACASSARMSKPTLSCLLAATPPDQYRRRAWESVMWNKYEPSRGQRAYFIRMSSNTFLGLPKPGIVVVHHFYFNWTERKRRITVDKVKEIKTGEGKDHPILYIIPNRAPCCCCDRTHCFGDLHTKLRSIPCCFFDIITKNSAATLIDIAISSYNNE